MQFSSVRQQATRVSGKAHIAPDDSGRTEPPQSSRVDIGESIRRIANASEKARAANELSDTLGKNNNDPVCAMPIPDAAEPSCVYLLINPLLSRPFYVGARPPGKQTVLNGIPPRDREACQRIMAAIREAGSRVQVAKVAFVAQEKALEVEASWIGMLVRGAVDLVNHQVDEAMRQRAISTHLAICRQAAPAAKGKGKSSVHPGQGDLFIQPLPPALPSPAPLPAVVSRLPPPEDIDTAAPRSGQPWTDAGVRLLASRFLSGETVDSLAMRLGRTPAAILAKLAMLAATRRDVKERMLEIGLRRSGWMRPVPPRDETAATMRQPYPPPNWMRAGSARRERG
jgi:hypothetical protein